VKRASSETSRSEVSEISAMIGWKGLNTAHYTNVGPYLIRGVDFENGILNFSNIVCVDRSKYEEQPQIHLRAKDIIMTKDGTIGKAIVVPELYNEACAGSTVVRIRPDERINSYYLEFVLNHHVCQVQIKSFATGLAQPHITQECIAEIEIPRILREQEIADKIEQHHLLLYSACDSTRLHLIDKAKSDVEDLIDGSLNTEALVVEGEEVEH
jgi:type I restriction enzyme S subunit